MKILKIDKVLKRLDKISHEIRYAKFVEGRNFSAGVISFKAKQGADSKDIRHTDKDVLCHVLKGTGRLRAAGRRIALKPGMLCHIPRGTPHDFAAVKRSTLVLFYSLIKTR